MSWALKALAKIVPPERLADELLALLDQFDTEYIRYPEPKIQLINELSRHPTEEVRVAIEPFLKPPREFAGQIGDTFIFCLPGSTGACRDGWDLVLSNELDSRYRPCSLAGQIPRLRDVCA